MNPVRTLGPAIAANNYKGIWLYLIAPILGALGGAGAYTAVKLPDEEFNSEVKASSAPGSFRRWWWSSTRLQYIRSKNTS